MSYRFFLFRSISASDHDKILYVGPYVVDDATLCLEPWLPSFWPSPDCLPRIVLWMRLRDLPTMCWNALALQLIIFAASKFVQMDESTSFVTKCRYARVAVEVNMAIPLVTDTDMVLEGVDAPIFWQRFEYEHVHLFSA